jgi:hypothetical protein
VPARRARRSIGRVDAPRRSAPLLPLLALAVALGLAGCHISRPASWEPGHWRAKLDQAVPGETTLEQFLGLLPPLEGGATSRLDRGATHVLVYDVAPHYAVRASFARVEAPGPGPDEGSPADVLLDAALVRTGSFDAP